MRPEPPAQLVDLLARLELATPEQLRRAAPRVHRLARDLPLFESVWIDALAQARVLTPFQAAELNAGRGDALRIGTLVYGASEPRTGAVESTVRAGELPGHNHRFTVVAGVLEPDCRELMQQFFKRKRERGASATGSDAPSLE